MMSLWDALRMNMMISYQELVRTFPYKFRESESLKSFLANEVKEGKNADKNVNQYKSKFFAK